MRLVRALCVLAFAGTAATAAAQPLNNNFASAEVIGALPFTDTEPLIGQATTEATDPTILCRAGAVGTGGNSVWYSYTTGAATEYVSVTTATSSYDTTVAMYTGGPG